MPEQPCEKLRLTWRPQAVRQWERILTFYAKRNDSAAYSQKLDAKLDDVLKVLCERPEWGERSVKRKDCRRFVFDNFAVFYRFGVVELEVTAVVDARRNVRLD